MKISQKPSYSPITITLETSQEAKDFIALIDDIDAITSNCNWKPIKLTPPQKRLLIAISNEFTERIGLR